jgi:hypothetical protein
MTVTYNLIRNRAIIDAEIRALKTLIGKRTTWLENPANKAKSTFRAVNVDTEQMKQNLAELIQEMKDMLKPNTH